jgi:hypothetical protein
MRQVIRSHGLPDATVFGEAFGPGIKGTRGIVYSNGQESLFRAFDIMVGESFVTYDLFVQLADEMGLPRVPEVWRGEPTQEALDALLNKPSTAAMSEGVADPSNLAEGVVIRSNPLFRNSYGSWLIAKHKGAKFSEVAHAPAEKKAREESPAEAYAAKFVTGGRLANAWERLQDAKTPLQESMADMPVLIAAVVADLRKEEAAEWPAGVSDKQMSGCVSRVLSPLFRAFLSQGW